MDSDDDFKLKFDSCSHSSLDVSDAYYEDEGNSENRRFAIRGELEFSGTNEEIRSSKQSHDSKMAFESSQADLSLVLGVLESSTGQKWRTCARELIIFERDETEKSGNIFAIMPAVKNPNKNIRLSEMSKKKTKGLEIEKGGLFKNVKEVSTYRKYLERMLEFGSFNTLFCKKKKD